jgi:predicted ribosome quality control (RQC) complex YloA/Tae2 family protein
VTGRERVSSKGRPYRTLEVDGFEVLVGKSDADNDRLTFEVAEPVDLWMHVAGYSGSHVIVRNPERLATLPAAVIKYAAQLAAWYSKARGAGRRVAVHICRAADVSKPPSFPAGKVLLADWWELRVYPRDPSAPAGDP